MAWGQRLSCLIKVKGSASAFRGATLVKVDKFSWERLSIIDLSHYQIVPTTGHPGG
jgi:hypothetical protein